MNAIGLNVTGLSAFPTLSIAILEPLIVVCVFSFAGVIVPNLAVVAISPVASSL